MAKLASLVLAAVLLAALLPVTAATAATRGALAVTGLSTHSGGTWGNDLVTIKGTGFSGAGGRRVAAVLFGPYQADGFWVVNATTIKAHSPQVANTLTPTDVRVMLADDALSPRSPADVFTFVVPTVDTAINGGWSANQSRAIGDAMIGRAGAVDAAPVAASPGYWTPAMGRSAVQRAAAWLGMPYAWAGGTYTGPSVGSCVNDGPITTDCLFRGFDCSGLTLYASPPQQHNRRAASPTKSWGLSWPSQKGRQSGAPPVRSTSTAVNASR